MNFNSIDSPFIEFNPIEGESNVNIKNQKGGTSEYMFVIACNKIYKKDFLIKNDLFFMDIKSGPEDEDLYQRILLVNKKTSYNHKAVIIIEKEIIP